MKICVTGGSGFIGTNMLLALRERYPAAAISSIDIRHPAYPVDDVEYLVVDVRNKDALHAALINAAKIFHLAALIGTHESFKDPEAVFDTNVNGTLNVLDFAREHQVEAFVAGMPGIWNNPYSISKDASVRLTLAYSETYSAHVCSLRWFSVYGPYQYVARYNKAIPTFVNQALKSDAIPIYGDGNQIADYIHAEDAVNAAIDMLEHKQWGKVYECATGTGISVNNLVQEIVDLCGSASKSTYLPMRQGEPNGAMVVADIAKLQTAIPTFKPRPLRDGLLQTISYYKNHPALD